MNLMDKAPYVRNINTNIAIAVAIFNRLVRKQL